MSKQAWYILIALCAIADALIVFLVSNFYGRIFIILLIGLTVLGTLLALVAFVVAWLISFIVARLLNFRFTSLVKSIKLPWKVYKYYYFSSTVFQERIKAALERELSIDKNTSINRLSKIELSQIEAKFKAWLINELAYNFEKITAIKIRDYLFKSIKISFIILAVMLVLVFLSSKYLLAILNA